MTLIEGSVIAAQLLVYAAFLPAAAFVGNLITRRLVLMADVSLPSGPGKAGRYIGALERLIIMAGIVFGSWEVVAAVIALKTVARYKELDKQLPAEAFLIGSLASVLWATLLAVALILFDSQLGFDFLSAVRDALSPPGAT